MLAPTRQMGIRYGVRFFIDPAFVVGIAIIVVVVVVVDIVIFIFCRCTIISRINIDIMITSTMSCSKNAFHGGFSEAS
jgi:uncharacterized membrane protein YqiK